MMYSEYPALSKLRLPERAMESLRTQGFVCAEPRSRKQIYKLRFRLDSRQHVRFLGDDAEVAREVQAELNTLQREILSRRQFAELRRGLRNVLKQSKVSLQGLLEERGFHYHGQAIRRRRKATDHDEF